MYGLQSSLYSAALTLCVLFAGVWRDRKSTLGNPSRYFTWFLIGEALNFAFELLMAHPDTPLKAIWLGLRMSGSLLIAPCLWLALREISLGQQPPLRELGRGNLIAIVVGMFLTLPLMQTAHLGHDFANPERVTSALQSRFIHGTMLGCIGIFGMQVPLFLLRCRTLLLTHQSATNPSVTWMQWPLLVVATTWALGLLRTVQCATHAPKELTLVFALTEVGVTVGAIYVLMRRAAVAVLDSPRADREPSKPVADNEAPSKLMLLESVQATVPQVKYARSRLTPVIRERIKRKLHHALAVDYAFRDSSVSLRSLSDGLKENVHYVSQVISQDFASSFYELVNGYRIEAAKRLLKAAPEKTVLEIALEVGFNSKSTFNTAFRRYAGMTPTEFRR
jgi:AraC-like DNA-binding protein